MAEQGCVGRQDVLATESGARQDLVGWQGHMDHPGHGDGCDSSRPDCHPPARGIADRGQDRYAGNGADAQGGDCPADRASPLWPGEERTGQGNGEPKDEGIAQGSHHAESEERGEAWRDRGPDKVRADRHHPEREQSAIPKRVRERSHNQAQHGADDEHHGDGLAQQRNCGAEIAGHIWIERAGREKVERREK